jgi:hypothetical protein
VCRRLLLVANVGATLPDADTKPIATARRKARFTEVRCSRFVAV